MREQSPNVALMIPFVRTRWELEECLELVDASPLGRQRGLHRWVMAEVPSVVHWLPEYIGMGIDGISIGSNDLTQLVLGVDRDSEECAELFDEADPAVLHASPAAIRSEVKRALDSFGAHTGHVFNLGHGITPDVEPENLRVLIDAVHEFSAKP